MPTIVGNAEKQEAISRLKKAYSVISNAMRSSQFENGAFSTWEKGENIVVETYFQKYWFPYFSNIKQLESWEDAGYKSIMPWKNIDGTEIGWNILSSNSRAFFRLADGTIVFYPRNSYELNPETEEMENIYVDYFYVDINGPKKPNVIGKDIFMFQVKDYDNLKPFCYTTDSNIDRECSEEITRVNENCCTAKIIKDGWQIKDNYPW